MVIICIICRSKNNTNLMCYADRYANYLTDFLNKSKAVLICIFNVLEILDKAEKF